MITTSEQINELAAALAKAQAELENVSKDRENPHFRSRYATLAGVLDEVRPKLAKQGISVVQMPVNGDGTSIGVVTRLLHSSGQWIEGAFYVAPTKADAQGAGSALTYARRYSLMAVAGVGPEDDDAEAAVGRPQGQRGSGVTRTAAAPAAPQRPVNVAALPVNIEESAEATQARQRVRMLIDQYQHRIRTAPNRHALELVMDDGREELAEIEAAGEAGKEAARKLRDKAMLKLEAFDEDEGRVAAE